MSGVPSYAERRYSEWRYSEHKHKHNIAILNVVTPNEVVGGDDGGIDQKNQPPTTFHW